MYDETSEEKAVYKDLAEQESNEPHVAVNETARRLENLPEKAILEGLDDLHSFSKFCCGGRIKVTNTIRLHRQLNNTTGESAELILPGSNEELLPQFFFTETMKCEAGIEDEGASTSLTCERGLDAKEFFTSFQLCDTSILGDIKSFTTD